MPKTPDSESLHSVMARDGYYNRHSQTQAMTMALGFSYLEKAAASVLLSKEGEVFRVADLGSSQGKNSLEPLRRVFQILRGRREDCFPISVVHTDQPGNDFSALFTMLQEKPDSYLRAFSEIYPSAIGRSFYGPLFPPNSLHLGWSSIALHWMSRVPLPLKNHIVPEFADESVFAAYARQANVDWLNFLTHRARELKAGGHLVMVAGAADENRKGGGALLYDRMDQVLKELVKGHDLEPSEYEAFVLPIYTRTVEEFKDPIQTGPLKEYYRMEGLRFDAAPDAQCLEYQKEGDAEKFATELTGFLRAFTEPLFRGALNHKRDPQKTQSLVEKLYGNFWKSVREDPKSIQLQWNIVSLHLMRTQKEFSMSPHFTPLGLAPF